LSARAEEQDGRGVLWRERRLGRAAGAAGVLFIVFIFAALIVQARASGPRQPGPAGTGGPGGLGQRLREFDSELGLQALALGCKVVAYVLLIALALFVYTAVRRRNPALSKWQGVLAVAGPLSVAVSALAGFVALAGVADAFVADATQTEARARALAGGSTFLRASAVFEIVAQVVLGAWVAWSAYSAMQVGLLTRFLGVFGVSAAVAGVVFAGIGEALVLGYVGSLALLALGWWPGGRPAAWEVNRAVPWD
jgi:hypothetical protein